MKQKLAFALCASLFASSNLMAMQYSNENIDNIVKTGPSKKMKNISNVSSDAMNKKLLNKINKLEKELQAFKKDYNEQIDDLNDRVDENEFQSALNRIKWGGEFETTAGNYWGRLGSITGYKKGSTFNNHNKWDLKLRLTMRADINDRTKFTGRLSMYKGWASNQKLSTITDSSEGRINGGSTLYVERAYIDYKITNKLVVTIGRQPSSDGPGMNLKNNTPRKSTYPAILFNGNADGIVLSYKLPKKIPHGYARLAYGKGFQWSNKQYGYLANQDDLKDLDVFGAFLEGSLPSEKMGDNLIIFSAVRGVNFVGNPEDTNTSSNKNLGSFSHFGLYFENNRAFGSRFNYFISLAMSIPKPNGKSYNTPNGPMSLLKEKGYAYHIGARYDFRKVKVGYEFNHGSRYWFSYTSGPYDLLNKIATRGDANDVYLMYQMDMNQFLRLGFTYLNYNYSGSGWHIAPNGTPPATNDYVKTLYLTYNVKF